ncbi:MAG: hypothetical protein ABJA10_00110 [Aestuariivirga sp.]
MAQPTPYALAYSFQNYQVSNPTRPLPADKLETEFSAVALTLSQALANLKLLQRDDGGLANLSVGYDQLKVELALGLAQPVAWAANTTYSKRDTVFNGTSLYRATIAHTSVVFASDLANGNWEFLVNLTFGASAVTTFNGRTDIVVPLVGDYSAFYQGIDADLTAVAGLAVTGIVRRTGVGTWSAGTAIIGSEIAAGTVGNSKLANMGANTFKVNNTAFGAPPVDATVAQTKALLAISNSDVSGLGALAVLSTVNLSTLATGTLQAAQFPALTGDVTTSAGALATTIAAAVVTLAKMANLAANSIIGNNTGSPATPIALTATQATAMLNIATTALKGLVPVSGGGTTNFLRADLTFAAPPSGGSLKPHITILTSGTTFTTNAATVYAIVEACGGGGGSADSAASAAAYSAGAGGGGYVRKVYTLAPSTSYTIAIGAAGAVNGAGGNTTFTDGVTLITAGGGAAGPPGTAATRTTGGAGGTAANGDVNIPGEAGGSGSNLSTTTMAIGGKGGGCANYGFGGPENANGSATGVAGTVGSGFGAGGGGASNGTSSGVARAGAGGATGALIFAEFY